MIENIDDKKKIKDYESIEEAQKKKNSLEIETELDTENLKEKTNKNENNNTNKITFIIFTFIFIGIIAYYISVKFNEYKKESQLDPKNEVLHIDQQTQNNDTNMQSTQNKDINQTSQNVQNAENNITNQTVQNSQTQNNETNQTVQNAQANQTNLTDQDLKRILNNGTNQTIGHKNVSLHKSKSKSKNKKDNKPKILFYDFLPKCKKPIKNIKDIFNSNRLFLSSKELTIEYIDFIKPINHEEEVMYHKVLFPNKYFEYYRENHNYNYSYLLSKLRKQKKSTSSKPKNKKISKKTKGRKIIKKTSHNVSANMTNTSIGQNHLNNITLNISVAIYANNSMNNISNSMNNISNSMINVNNSMINVNNSMNNISNSLINVNNSINNISNSMNNISNSMININNSNNLTLANNITNNDSHSLRNLGELNQKILKDFYMLCDQTRIDTVTKNKKQSWDKPAISIIIPFFNNRLNLIKTLRSLQLQTLKNIEIIIVDDNNVQVNKEYKNLLESDYRLRLFSQPKNMGLWRKRIDGFLYSRGKYILHINPGDILADSFVLEELYHLVSKYSLDTLRFSFSKTKYDRDIFNNHIYFNKRKIYPEHFTRIIYGRPDYNVHIFGYGTIWNRLVRANVMRKGLDLLDKDLLNLYKDLWEDMWWNDLIDRVSFSNLIINRLGYIFLYDRETIYEPQTYNKFVRNKSIQEFILFWYWDYYLLPKNDNKKSIVDTLRKYARPENTFCQLHMSLEFLIERFKPYEKLLQKLMGDPFVDADDKLFVSYLYNSTKTNYL